MGIRNCCSLIHPVFHALGSFGADSGVLLSHGVDGLDEIVSVRRRELPLVE